MGCWTSRRIEPRPSGASSLRAAHAPALSFLSGPLALQPVTEDRAHHHEEQRAREGGGALEPSMLWPALCNMRCSWPWRHPMNMVSTL